MRPLGRKRLTLLVLAVALHTQDLVREATHLDSTDSDNWQHSMVLSNKKRKRKSHALAGAPVVRRRGQQAINLSRQPFRPRFLGRDKVQSTFKR